MEWVETTGRSVQDAKDKALDELGVDEADAEFEVVADAQTGLFGRLRSEARVRARVRPTAPRAKEERRNRERRRRANEGTAAAATTAANGAGGAGGAAGANGGRSRGSTTGSAASPVTADEAGSSDTGPGDETATVAPRSAVRTARAPRADTAEAEDTNGSPDGDADVESGDPDRPAPRKRNRNRKRSRSSVGSPGGDTGLDSEDDDDDLSGKGPEVEVDMARQGEVAVDFLTQLTAEFGLEAQVSLAQPDDDTVEIQLTGPNLGILIGPKGATLVAVQNLTRTVVFNETGGSNGHIYVDVGGYRQKRTEALTRFATQVAEQVKANGNRTALEPMSAVDRKVVHDTISAIEGVQTISEGEEPRRRVVVLPG
ncbi:MAG: Jag N-terminal domain-containing protein [Acidobacteriota bacterium]|nr:Jag N-terminal domain-containing protein [Acidobacteriota bacterium]